uniref:DUF4062 domain-containing protein n=1 Tax=Burkholderia sp. (strain CCGE1003) TaxID=640512 RepID=E1T7F6_BURSG
MEKKYQVFISSTYTDMKDERQAAVMAILDAGHIPAGMELFAAADKKQMDVIEKWIDASDIFMLILGGRYGSIDPDSGKSYIQLEYEYAMRTGKPLFALYLTDPALDEKVKNQGRAVIEQDDSRAYKEFRALVTGKMCAPVGHIKDIFIQARKSIETLAKDRELDGWVRASSVTKAAPQTAPLIEMFTDASGRYHVDELYTENNLSTVKIGIKNAGGGTLSNCKVYVEAVEPPPSLPTAPRILLETGVFQLRHDDPERLVDVAAHWSHMEMFRFSAPLPGGVFGNPFNLTDCGTRTFTVRVIATECERAAQFELETDESKRLHLKFLRYAD